MKNLLRGFLFAATCTALPVFAWHFKFSNHTNEELKILIHLVGDPSDKWYSAVLGPKTEKYDFKFGADVGYTIVDAEFWKGGLCLGDVKIQTPLMEKKTTTDDKTTWMRRKDSNGAPMWNPARPLESFYIKDEAYDAMIEAAKAEKTSPSLKEIQSVGQSAPYGQCKDMHYHLIQTTNSNIIAITNPNRP